MTPRSLLLFPTIIPLFGVGSALTVLYRQQQDIDHLISIPQYVYSGLLWLGIILIVLALVLVLCRIVSDGLVFVLRGTILGFHDPPRYKCRPIRANELHQHHAYWEKFFPGDISSLAQNKAWYRKNDKLFWFLFEVASRKGKRHDEPKLVGSFSMIPLTKSAALQVYHEELSGPTFTAEHIAKASKPPAIYIGGVVAEGLFAKAEALARLSEKIDRLLEKKITIFTRPVTDDGLRLVKKYEFVPTGGTPGLRRIYQLGEFIDGTEQA